MAVRPKLNCLLPIESAAAPRQTPGISKLRSWKMRRSLVPLFLLVIALASSVGCDTSPEAQRERDEKTRDEVAKATAKAKPVIEEAGRKLDDAARSAAHDLKATAQGARDGWKNGPHSLLNVNSASEADLESLPGISRADARRIIENRPYSSTHELVTKNAISSSDYEKIRDRVTAK
jgi:DNA uptake protein ComE-like DNA-binding protein